MGTFIYKTEIRLHDTDAAGPLFFANQFTIIHDAYEQLLETGTQAGFLDAMRTRAELYALIEYDAYDAKDRAWSDQVEGGRQDTI